MQIFPPNYDMIINISSKIVELWSSSACPKLQRLSCISGFCNLVSKINLRGLFRYPPTHVFGLRRIIHIYPAPTMFVETKQQRHIEGVRQLTLPVLSHRPNVCLCVKLCVIPMPRLTHRSREDSLVNGEQGPWSPLLPSPSLSSSPLTSQHSNSPFPLSSLSYMLSLSSLLLSKLAQLSISPPAVPPAVCPPQTRSPTTIRVTGQEKEQAAFTMDQWRPVKQSLPFSPPAFLPCCQDWKRQTFWRGSWRGGKSSWTTALEAPSPSYNCLTDHNDKHTWTHLLLSTLHLYTQSQRSLSVSSAIISLNAVIKVKFRLLSLVEWYKCVKETCQFKLIWK